MDDMPAGYYHPLPYTGHYHSPPTSSHHPYYPPPPAQASPPPHGAPPPPYSRTPLPPLSQSHHSPPYALRRTPPYGSAYAASGELPSFDEVWTLFVAGLPGDVKVREVYNLFREFPGYESAKLRSSGQSSQAYAFVVFTDQQSALAAMHSVNVQNDENIYSSDRRVRGSATYSRDFRDSGAGSNTHMPGMIYSSYSGYPSTQSNKKLAYDAEHNNLNYSSANATESNPPCPTLFVSNLGSNCTEKELTQVFSRCPGFL